MTLQLYILRQVLVSIGFAVAGIAMIVLPAIAIQAIHKLGAVGVTALVTYLPLVLVELVPYLLPMAFLLGVVVTYGRMAAERELIAIRMAGVHPTKLCLPAVVVAVPLCAWTAHLVSNVAPVWKYEQRQFLRSVDKEAFESLSQGRTELTFGNSSLVALRRSGNVFYDVLLDLKDQGAGATIMAEAVELAVRDDTLFLEFSEARVLGKEVQLYNEVPVWSCPLEEFFPERPKDRARAKYMSSGEIRTLLEGDIEPARVPEMRFEIHRRYALSGTYLLFLLIGIPTGIVLRSSTQLGAITGAAGAAFVYYAFAMQLGKALVKSNAMHPVAAAWVTNAVFLVVGLVCFYRALCR